jgi:hypothetical protein
MTVTVHNHCFCGFGISVIFLEGWVARRNPDPPAALLAAACSRFALQAGLEPCRRLNVVVGFEGTSTAAMTSGVAAPIAGDVGRHPAQVHARAADGGRPGRRGAQTRTTTMAA